jgi:hypothetical protein
VRFVELSGLNPEDTKYKFNKKALEESKNRNKRVHNDIDDSIIYEIENGNSYWNENISRRWEQDGKIDLTLLNRVDVEKWKKN